MAFVPDQKFSTFEDGGNLDVNDIVVGLRNGINTRFTYSGVLPPSVVVPIANGGTGATTAAGARFNLGLGTMATQNANAVAITGGSAALTSGSVVSAPASGTDIANKTYVDGLDSGNVKSVSGTANRITSTGGQNPIIDIDATYVGQSSITTLGTVSSGTWQATIVGLSYGGTGANLTASNGGIVYSNASSMAILAGTSTANQALLSGSSSAPAWSTATYPPTTTANQLLYSSAINTITGLATANRGLLITDASGVPAIGNSILVTEDLTGIANPGNPVLNMTNSTGMTYPTSPFSITLGSRLSALLTTTQTINSGTNTIIGNNCGLTYSGSGTNDLSALSITGSSISTSWTSSNTAFSLTNQTNTLTYNGSNQGGRTTNLLAGMTSTQILTPPSSSSATVATFRGIQSDLRDSNTTATSVTKTIATLQCFNATGQVTNSAASNISNITNLKLYDSSFTINGSGAGSQVNITNFYGLHLQAPTTSGTFTITNRYGIKQDDASASNVFAGTISALRMYADSVTPGLTSTATAAGTTTLTVSSNQIQLFTGTTTQTVILPVVSTLALGQSFKILNNSTDVITVQSSGGNTIKSVQAGTSGDFYCISLSGTTAASWYSGYVTMNPIAVPFTPTITYATPGDLSMAYAIQTGNYYRFGNAIFVAITIRFTPTYTTASGELRIGGLPISSIANWVLTTQISTQNVTFNASGTQVVSNVPSNYIRLTSQGSGAASSSLTTTNFVSGTQYTIIVSGFYGI